MLVYTRRLAALCLNACGACMGQNLLQAANSPAEGHARVARCVSSLLVWLNEEGVS